MRFDAVNVASVKVVETSKVVNTNCKNNLNILLKISLMPSTRKQEAKAEKFREMNILSDYDNNDIMLGD